MDCKHTPISSWKAELRGDHVVILADTPCRRSQGLQGIKQMPPTTLLLFPNIRAGSYMHTKNCYFPIDIIYLNGLDLVVGIKTAYPNKDRVGPAPIGTSKIIEASGGWCNSRHIGVGDNLQAYSSVNLRW
jgi:uncharacterized membrane protein (UPF0127 family)